MNPSLKINTEFEKIIPELSEHEFEQLEENIVSDGEILNPIIVWNGVIIDGHKRYKIAQKHPEIKFTLVNNDKTIVSTSGSNNLLKTLVLANYEEIIHIQAAVACSTTTRHCACSCLSYAAYSPL